MLRLLLVVVSSALSLALMDGAFRLYERRFLVHEVDPDASVYDLDLYEYNDHEGFLERTRAQGEFRILSFGDSFAESVTKPQFTYASVIQRNLSSAVGRRRVRVVNFGRNGTSFPDYVSQLRIWSRKVEFDAVLFNLYAGNDFFDMSGVVFVEAHPSDYRSSAGGGVLRYGPGVDIPRRFPLRSLDYAFALYYSHVYASEDSEEADLYQPRALQYPRDVYLRTQAGQVSVYRPDRMEDYFDAYFWLFKLLLAAVELEERGIRVAISMAPPHFVVSEAWTRDVLSQAGVDRDRIHPGLPAIVVSELAREVGFQGPVLDLTACLRAASARGEEVYYGTNTHWNVRGNQIVGDLLADALSRYWFDGTLDQYDEAPEGCTGPIGPATPEVSRSLAEAVAVIRDLLHFEQTTLAPLLGRTFGDRAELFAALEAAGYHNHPGRVRGAFWGLFTRPGDPIIRPHGLRRFVRPHGWAIDSGAPGQSVFIAFLHRGRVIGVGRTREPPGESLPWLSGVEADTPNVLFQSLIKKPVPRLRGPDELWVVAIAPSGYFASLSFTSGGPLPATAAVETD